MTEGIEAVTRASLSLALDAAMLRHQTIANNIANVNTEGFISQRVNFADFVKGARQQLDTEGRLSRSTVDALVQSSPSVEPLRTEAGLPVSVQLDAEVAQMAQNSVQYQALLKGLSRQMSILSIAVADGKR